MTSIVPTATPAVTDACGCVPHTPLTGEQPAPADPPPVSPQAATSDGRIPRRTIKLVVTLTPTDGGQYRAALALGAEECDPVLHSTTVSTLTGALEQVPGLLEEADERWRVHPRNPTAARVPTRGTGADRFRSRALSLASPTDEPSPGSPPGVHAEDSPLTPPVTEPAVTPSRPTGGQLTLFG
jgi:hypothetical protein